MCVLLIPKNEIILSQPNTKIAPNKNPNATGTKAYLPFSPYVFDSLAISIAGANNDQNEAAIITPAAKPSAASNDLRYKIQTNKINIQFVITIDGVKY